MYPFTSPSPPCYCSFLPLSSRPSTTIYFSSFSTLFLLPCHLSSFSLPRTHTITRTPTPGDRTGPEVRSQTLVSDRQAPEGAYRQAVPRALAQPPEPGGEEDIVDRGGRPDHLPGTREVGQPLGRNR